MTDSSSESTAVETTNDVQSTQQTSDSNSASSTETKPAETMLDRVRSTLDQTRTDAAPASSVPGKSTQVADPAKPLVQDDGSKEFTTDEMATLAPRTQARMRKLTSDLQAQGRELQTLQPKAVEYDKIESFITRNGLQPRDVQSVAEIASMLVHNPVGALERLVPIMQELYRVTGGQIPADLQQQVEQGYLTEQHARELSQARARQQLAERRANSLVESQQRDAERSSQQRAVQSGLDAMDSWEKATAKNDPDWHQKQSEVSELVELAIERKSRESGRPWFPSAQESNDLLQKAYETVNDRFKRFSPKPTAIKPAVAAGASPRSVPAPKNTMDIIRANLR